MTTEVYVLHHSYDLKGSEESKLIGVYSSRNAAEQAAIGLRVAPGFRDFPDHFVIDGYSLDETGWQEGFVTKTYVELWSVWRLDDNGNTFLVSTGHTEDEAFQVVIEYEEKGHKQMYWAKPR